LRQPFSKVNLSNFGHICTAAVRETDGRTDIQIIGQQQNEMEYWSTLISK